MISQYMNLRSIPALLGVAFMVASLYQFGGISSVELVWFDYTLTTEHAMLVSVATYVVAFASSKTRQFANYEKWEQVLIAAGPILLIGHQYSDFIADLIATEGNTGPILGFVIAAVSYGIAVGK